MEAAAVVTAYGRRILQFMIAVINSAGKIPIEEVEPVLPQVIVGMETKFLDYNGLVPVAIGAIQEMKRYYDEKIANLEMQLEEFKKA
ncbi:hypothetical protein [Scytonema sp. NUACC21]